MNNKVAVVGCGQTKYEKAKNQVFYEVAFSAASQALQMAGLDKGDIENVVLAGYDVSIGRTISNMYIIGAAAGYLKDEIKVADDGIYAFALGCMRVMAGLGKTLVLAYGINSESPFELVSNLTLDPLFHREIGLSHTSALALQVSAYKNKYKVNDKISAEVVVKNRKYGKKNPLNHLKKEVNKKEVLNSPYISYPLRALEIAPVSDGCVALILCDGDEALRITSNPVWIKSIAWYNDNYFLGSKDITEISSLKLAAEKAYKQAEINNPLEEINFFELTELTSYHELMIYEALGLCKLGEAKNIFKEINKKTKINVSGGALSSNPYCATGLSRVAEVYLQLTNNAGKRQIENAKIGLAHGYYGFCYQGNCVAILEK